MRKQIIILQGMRDTWVTFKDEFDLDNNLMGRTIQNPTRASLNRLARLSESYYTTFTIDDREPIIFIQREVPTSTEPGGEVRMETR